YSKMKGYNPDADLGLGCGLPTEFAHIKEGDTVVDLGSGAGNDCFIARELTGPQGRVIGIDMTPEMIEKANRNADKLGFSNVRFRLGEIDNIPMAASQADVVVSNCVFNLVPNKQKAFEETYRILRPGGHFSISDVVVKGDLPDKLREDAEMYAGCVSGAITMDEYLENIRNAGFTSVALQKERPIELPDDILDRYLNESEKVAFKTGSTGILSITVYAVKPQCVPGSGCC
ncbi:MAG TPA: arsenite methyltransferase, partial [Balneolales bacterium]|nr:arsenite methyltransferase [Balneolales bacterium]